MLRLIRNPEETTAVDPMMRCAITISLWSQSSETGRDDPTWLLRPRYEAPAQLERGLPMGRFDRTCLEIGQ